MNLKTKISTTLVSAALLGISSWANAIPTLQLGIGGGTYDATTQTSIASANSFSLYAYLLADSSNPIGDSYTISMAVSPQVNSPASLGSFSVDGAVIDVTSGMTYGIPPLDATIETTPGGDNHDLQTHGVFPTYFIERTFSFSAADQTAAFNTADHPSFGPQPGSGMYFKKFDIDVTGLDENYSIHFDLYNSAAIGETVCTGKGKSRVCTTTPTGELDISQFAPFSHDAQSGPGGGGGGGGNEVPEPASMLLVALGLFGLGFARKKA